MLTALAAILVFSLLIVAHEGGHFLAAKAANIRVNEFSIGMGPKIFSKQKGETTYSLRLFPIGGYVAMEGEDEDSEDPRSFFRAPIWHRIRVVVAGALTNFLFAFLIFIVINLRLGMVSTTIEDVSLNFPAYEAGIHSGDKILAIDGHTVKEWTDVNEILHEVPPGEEVEVVVQRDNQEQIFRVGTVEAEGRTVMGVTAKLEYGFFKAVKEAVRFMGQMIGLMFTFLGNLFRGQVSRADVGGPIVIISEVGKAASLGIWNLLMFLGFLNVNLGFINLLPIPALDGSRLVFLLFEAIRGKPIPQEKEAMVHFLGFVCLMILMVYIFYLDLGKIGVL